MAKKTMDMTTGKPMPLLIKFALPLMAGNIFQQMYTMVDTMIVGKGVGVEALASIGAADWLNWLVLGLVLGFPQGFSILIAQFFGAKEKEKLSHAVNVSLTMSVVIGIVIAIASLLMTRPMLVLMSTPERIIKGSQTYLYILFGGSIIPMMYNLFAGFLRSMGNSKTPLFAMVFASLTNIVLDCLFVFGLHFGIAGAAIATIIAQSTAMVICLNELHKLDVIHLKWTMDFQMANRLWKLALPVAFQNTIIAVGGLVVQWVVNGYGVNFIASYTATNKLYGVLEFAAISYGYAMATYCGQNLGAKQYDRISKGVKEGCILAALTSFVVSAVMIFGGKGILSLFISGDDPMVRLEVLKTAYEYLFIMASFLVILFMLHLVRSALQGVGDTVTPMISGMGELVMRISCCLLLPYVVGYKGLFIAEIAAWSGALVILYTGYRRFMKKLKVA